MIQFIEKFIFFKLFIIKSILALCVLSLFIIYGNKYDLKYNKIILILYNIYIIKILFFSNYCHLTNKNT